MQIVIKVLSLVYADCLLTLIKTVILEIHNLLKEAPRIKQNHNPHVLNKSNADLCSIKTVFLQT